MFPKNTPGVLINIGYMLAFGLGAAAFAQVQVMISGIGNSFILHQVIALVAVLFVSRWWAAAGVGSLAGLGYLLINNEVTLLVALAGYGLTVTFAWAGYQYINRKVARNVVFGVLWACMSLAYYIGLSLLPVLAGSIVHSTGVLALPVVFQLLLGRPYEVVFLIFISTPAALYVRNIRRVWESREDHINRLENDDASRVEALLRDREASDQLLRESIANLKALIDNTEDLIALRDTAGRLIVHNQASGALIKTLFGVDAVKGLCTLDYLPREKRHYWEEITKGVMEENRTHHEVFSYVFPNQETRYFELAFNPILIDGKVTGYSEFTRDITERVATQKALERRLEIEKTMSGIFTRLIRGADFDQAIFDSLHDLCRLASVPLAYTLSFTPETGEPLKIFCWDDSSGSALLFQPAAQVLDDYSAWLSLLRQGQIVHLTDLDSLGEGQDSVKTFLTGRGLKSLLMVPWQVDFGPAGLLGLGNTDTTNLWETDSRDFLQLITQILGSAFQSRSLLRTLEQRVNQRTRELQGLYEMASLAAQVLDEETFLQEGLKITLNAFNVTAGAIHLLSDDCTELCLSTQTGLPDKAAVLFRKLEKDRGFGARVAAVSKVLVITDLAEETLLQNMGEIFPFGIYLGAPLMMNDRQIGLLSVFIETKRAISLADIEFIRVMADKIAGIIEGMHLHQLSRKITIMEERQRLARELHDRVSQNLFSLNMTVAAASKALQAGGMERVGAYLNRIEDISIRAVQEMRLLIYELRPARLEKEGLAGALNDRLDSIERRLGIDTTLSVEDHINLTSKQEDEIYGIAQEVLNNVIKHARASHVEARLFRYNRSVRLEISDDGIGFDLAEKAHSGGMGLTNMRERCERIGATIEIFSKINQGTQVRVTLPISDDERK